MNVTSDRERALADASAGVGAVEHGKMLVAQIRRRPETERLTASVCVHSALAQQMAVQALGNLRDQQASGLSYFDCYLIFAVLGAVLAVAGLFNLLFFVYPAPLVDAASAAGSL